ncbi:hypothetical protein HMPREF9630_01840 [Peptoanaerobacter stomatis]|uniref:N-acetyltransferase domain-containing protein n=1 Tax=Peptoanaerobacter stomatis TaxID=796937 RepID=V9HK79_9FIRM|nr:GNAT family N-acetyltransferase [Peptoanaerobacter stomatis]EHL16751.1 hypothetical protein HMPREF9630_01840 [Peptoanaerobacter stomatis]NWO24306.1 GNAT family N-acetyltransferase [Peptostreptococcaceae bacterium oral taxon 081]
MEHIIKRYDVLDADGLSSMMREFYSTPGVLHKIDDSNIKSTIALLNQKSPFTEAFILKMDSNMVGYVLLAFTYSNEAGGSVVWIEEIYIKKEYRNRLLSNELLDYVIQEYPNTARFRIDMVKGNVESMALFSSFGFEELKYLQFIKER